MENLEYKIAKDCWISRQSSSVLKSLFSGIRASFSYFCDNRKALSYPGFRRTICESMIEIINADFKKVDVIAGVATGAIAYGAIVAEMMGKPFVEHPFLGQGPRHGQSGGGRASRRRERGGH